MGFFQKLFGGGGAAPVERSDQAVVVNMAGASIIDLRPLPPEAARILRAIGEVKTALERSPQPMQVWVASKEGLGAFSGGPVENLSALTDALYAASKRVAPMMIVEPGAPESVVYILRSLGFELYLPGMRLTGVDARGRETEVDVLEQLEKLRKAPRL
jgi:hypothetical protein